VPADFSRKEEVSTLKILTDLMNFFAKFSVDRWNKSRVLRKMCRTVYQAAGKAYTFFRKSRKMSISDRYALMMQMTDVLPMNTYPWPYVDARFANWEESDQTGDYTLVADPAGFVARCSTSYVAWKIRELTGRWPKKRGSENIYHARDWQIFLAENGYSNAYEKPFEHIDGYYVGIIPEEGEFGQLLWYEYARLEVPDYACARVMKIVCSTYTRRMYEVRNLSVDEAREIAWVRIA